MLEEINYITKRPRITVKKVAATRSGKAAARYRAAAEEFTRRLVAELGDQVQAVVFYGPAVVGVKPTEREQSLLVVGADAAEHVWTTAIDISSVLTAENNFVFSLDAQVIGAAQMQIRMRAGDSGIGAILKEGVVLYDNGFFSKQPDGLLPARR